MLWQRRARVEARDGGVGRPLRGELCRGRASAAPLRLPPSRLVFGRHRPARGRKQAGKQLQNGSLSSAGVNREGNGSFSAAFAKLCPNPVAICLELCGDKPEFPNLLEKQAGSSGHVLQQTAVLSANGALPLGSEIASKEVLVTAERQHSCLLLEVPSLTKTPLTPFVRASAFD